MTDYIKGGPDPAAVTLQCGPLTMTFEPDTAFLRYIRLGERELLRGIYAAVRDQSWDTIEARVSNPQISYERDGLLLTFDVRHIAPERNIDFFWKGRIACTTKGTVTFEMDGTARSTFLRNRIGFCVLHSHACAGQPCIVEKTDGSRTEGAFPMTIAPHQPFKSMQAITHEALPGVKVRVAFEGDVFEMEDQRNWTDASYKTYCTPVEQPMPVEVTAGARILQRISLSLHGDIPPSVSPSEARDVVEIEVEPESKSNLPAIGVGMSSLDEPLDNKSIDRLQALNLAHLRVDLELGSAAWRQALIKADRQARSLFTRLEVALFFSEALEEELETLLESLERIRPNIARWLVYPSDGTSTQLQTVEAVRPVLAQYNQKTPIVTGTNVYFTDLNRHRPNVAGLDGICYSMNPQVHVFDNRSLIETLAMQAITVDSARGFSEGRPIVISPVTLKPRFNPNATDPDDEPSTGMLPASVDPRQTTLFAAGWTMGSLKYLGEAGAASITYYETAGWRGIVETEKGSPMSMAFTSLPGSVFPLYHVFADLSGFSGGSIVRSLSGDPLRVESCVVTKGSRGRILVANVRSEEVSANVRLPNGWRVQKLRVIDETNVLHAMKHPNDFRLNTEDPYNASNGSIDLRLLPSAYACIDVRL